MTDLVSLADLQAQLQAESETRLLLDDAYRIAEQMQVTYEADRASKDATIADQATQIDELTALITDLAPDVTVTIGTTPVVSRFEPSITWANNPPIYGTSAWTTISSKAASLYGVESTHIFPFGSQEPWSKYMTAPTYPAPVSGISLGVNPDGTWSKGAWTLTGALMAMSGTKHMKIYGAPWWMRHKATKSGLVDCTKADMYSDVGRVKPSRLNDFLALVDAVVTVALEAGVLYFSVWNELKGYLDNGPADVSMNPGNATTPMGYGYLYKRVTEKIYEVAARMGITGVKVGGAYVVLRARSSTANATTDVSGEWGWLDKVGYDAVEQFMENVIANNLHFPDFVSVDGADYNKGLPTDGSTKPSDWYAADDFVNGQRYHDIHLWLKKYNVPIVWDEYYRYAVKTIYTDVTMRDAYDAVLVADFFHWCALDGVQWAFAWTPYSINFNGSRVPGQFYTSGQLTPYGQMTEQFRSTFPAGTNVYPLSGSNSVDGLASDTNVWLYNKTASPLKVALTNDVYELASYQLRVVSR